jgi:hypothetical protein
MAVALLIGIFEESLAAKHSKKIQEFVWYFKKLSYLCTVFERNAAGNIPRQSIKADKW